MRFKTLIVSLALVAVACAGNQPPAQPGTPRQKQVALEAAEVSQQTLIQAVHIEAGICNQAAAKAAPLEPVTTCTGPLATRANLTTEKHQAFSARMLKAFELHKEAVEKLKAWQPGQPIPVNISTFEAQVQAILALAQGLGGEDAAALSNIVTQVLKQIADIRAAIGR